MHSQSSPVWRWSAGGCWSLDRPRVLAILNVTPDSFSDGGLLAGPADALRAASDALAAGADGLDIGGESTRPGAQRVSADEQIRRAVPAVEAIRREFGPSARNGPMISIDTTLASVARAAIDAGADAINDVSAGAEDEGLFPLAAERGCGLILMHRLAPPGRDVYSHQYGAPPDYSAQGGVIGAVGAFLAERARAAERAGVRRDAIVIDPGLGFGKSVEQNLTLIEQTPRLCELGYPILSGVSRKSFTARAAGLDVSRPARERAPASVALSVLHLLRGARVFRVHDVALHVGALRAAWASMHASQPPGPQPTHSFGVQ